MPVELIRFLIVGFVAGWIASILVRGPIRARGCLTNGVIGMLGAVIGGYLFQAAGIQGPAGFVGSVVVATIGAVVFLVVLRLLRTV